MRKTVPTLIAVAALCVPLVRCGLGTRAPTSTIRLAVGTRALGMSCYFASVTGPALDETFRYGDLGKVMPSCAGIGEVSALASEETLRTVGVTLRVSVAGPDRTIRIFGIRKPDGSSCAQASLADVLRSNPPPALYQIAHATRDLEVDQPVHISELDFVPGQSDDLASLCQSSGGGGTGGGTSGGGSGGASQGSGAGTANGSNPASVRAYIGSSGIGSRTISSYRYYREGNDGTLGGGAASGTQSQVKRSKANPSKTAIYGPMSAGGILKANVDSTGAIMGTSEITGGITTATDIAIETTGRYLFATTSGGMNAYPIASGASIPVNPIESTDLNTSVDAHPTLAKVYGAKTNGGSLILTAYDVATDGTLSSKDPQLESTTNGATVTELRVLPGGNAVIVATTDGYLHSFGLDTQGSPHASLTRMNVTGNSSTSQHPAIAIDTARSKVALVTPEATALWEVNLKSDGSLDIVSPPSAQFICNNPTALALDPAGQYLYVTNGTNTVYQYAIDLAGTLSALWQPTLSLGTSTTGAITVIGFP